MTTVAWDGFALLEMMSNNEIEVARLYRAIADSAKKGFGAQFFERFAQDEERHHNIYEALKKQYQKNGELVTQLSVEDGAVLDALVAENVLVHTDDYIEKATKIWNKEQIYDICELIEKNTVAQVKEIIRLFPELAPDQMPIVLKEEEEHLAKIRQRRLDSGTAGRGL